MNHDFSLLPEDPKWKRFEKLVTRIYATLAPNARVTYDDRILGKKSNAVRQTDVAIRTSLAGSEILLIVQCRDYSHPVDVNDVGEFAVVVDDVGAKKE